MKTTAAIDSLAALAHENRLAIFRLLVQRGPDGLSAGEIGQRIGVVPSSLTFHLQGLHRCGLITQIRASRHLIYSANYKAMNALVSYLTENCCTSDIECPSDCQPVRNPKVSRRKAAA